MTPCGPNGLSHYDVDPTSSVTETKITRRLHYCPRGDAVQISRNPLDGTRLFDLDCIGPGASEFTCRGFVDVEFELETGPSCVAEGAVALSAVGADILTIVAGGSLVKGGILLGRAFPRVAGAVFERMIIRAGLVTSPRGGFAVSSRVLVGGSHGFRAQTANSVALVLQGEALLMNGGVVVASLGAFAEGLLFSVNPVNDLLSCLDGK